MHKLSAKKIILRTFIILMIFVALAAAGVFSINAYIKSSAKKRIISFDQASNLEGIDCILILGAGVWGDRPTLMLQDRLDFGIELYKKGVSDRLLMSGDHGRKDYDEVNVMKSYAINEGVLSSHIFMDHAGFSTYESLYRARDIFQAKKIIIVTQEYHLYRALYVADKLGLEAYGVASDPRQYVGQRARDVREILARVKDFFYVIVKPKPTYLGDSIPVSGNGDVTND
ncbi:vancomycin permeability regulator SanA [Herbinix hemicellulosilytica]|uniref:Putative membrane protein n=1 Tax=Herbinix hemicellulosilytica TaxID=1564487 RepID=A0A0H5SJZ0_HERHM|nr:ElyC/SanA/YdcF family protein [Herbinix hemicellulosilytica]RBP59137.1 vancomycin permeability regulator SanA [Herbinix hemicellulosilytica]CRZ35420.1 putative membrane protein [Herbinix hemicellulosilytica]